MCVDNTPVGYIVVCLTMCVDNTPVGYIVVCLTIAYGMCYVSKIS